MNRHLLLIVCCVVGISSGSWAEDSKPAVRDTSRGDAMIAAYFETQTKLLADDCLAMYRTIADWERERDLLRQQMFDMLGLNPLPEKTPLQPEVTGKIDHESFTVENVHFQSRPGLYVTGNLYVPKQRTEKLPAILYVCGHGQVKKDGISYGNKASYQHHGAWFARNGFVCLTIDTLQLGEIEGIHHGTHRYGRWWWNARGYTPAGVEAWNCIRALDYLETRDEVDASRMGVTGRSGGGAYSWWIAAIDDRIKAAVPVAGITTLKNHVVDGCVEGHCDCMFMVNTFRWDYPQVAALVAPRPLLISNTDKDTIFPLDGVAEVYFKVRNVYQLHGKANQLGLCIAEGPHKDIQELQVDAFHWFNRYLKNTDPPIEMAAVKFFQPEVLKVFKELPQDEINTRVDESFTQLAEPLSAETTITASSADKLRQRLEELSFRAWPKTESGSNSDLKLQRVFDVTDDGIALSAFDFTSQDPIRLRLYCVRAANVEPSRLKLNVLNILDETGWKELLQTLRVRFATSFEDELATDTDAASWEQLAKLLKSNPWGMAYVCPRGIGPTAWNQSEKKQIQHQRRFMLLGQTLEGMQTWDVRQSVQAARQLDGLSNVPLWLQAERGMSGIALYAALFERDAVQRLDLYDLPTTHHEGPSFLNVLRITDIPTTLLHVAHTSKVVVYENEPEKWSTVRAVADAHEAIKPRVQVRRKPATQISPSS